MKFKKLKIDFMTDEQCFFCKSGRKLKEGFLIKNNLTGELLVSSRSCYEKNKSSFSNNDEIIPNLTRGILNSVSVPKNIGSDKSKKPGKSVELSNIEYLILRQEKLRDVSGIPFEGIDDIYNSYRENYVISSLENNRLQRFIDKTKRSFPQLAPSKLQRLYATIFWMNYAIEKQPNEKSKNFMRSILKQYKTYRGLSIKQIEVIMGIIETLNSKIDNKRYHIPNVELLSNNE